MHIRHDLASALVAALALCDPVAPIVLELTIPEFVALQRLSHSERRSRFNLPASCDPTVAARRTGRRRVTVIIRCVGADVPDAAEVVGPHGLAPGVTNPGPARSTSP